MADLGRGARFTLPDLGANAVVDVGIDVSSAQNLAFDVCCFGVDAAGELLGDEWLVFFNNPSAPGGAVRSVGPHGGDEQVFRIDLTAVPADVARLVFTVSLEGEASMAAVAKGHLRILAGGSAIARYPYYGADFTTEHSVVVGELYRRNGWRFAAVGQGHEGGLAALVAAFGGEVEEDAPPSPAPPNNDVIAPPVPATLPAATADALSEPAPTSALSTIPAPGPAAEPAWALGPSVSGPPVSYKVLSHKDKFFGDRFDPEKVGEAIAAYAAMGWQPVGTATDRHGGGRDSLLVVLVREN
ncbi:MAG: TerD family protein [Sporichthyaceae bacterium]